MASQFTYDANGNMASRTDALGRTTSYVYDSLGQKTAMVAPTPTTLTGGPASTTTYTYDALGNLTQTAAPLSRTSSSTYDANSNKISSTDALGHTTAYVYDPLNRLIETDYPDGTKSTRTYDFRNNVIRATDQAGNVTLNAYDLNEEDAWQPELADIERKLTPRTRAVVLINPNNPTGSLCSRQMLEQIAEIARRHNLVVFSDEIYDKLILDCDSQGDATPHIAFAAVAPDVPCITFGGMSKNYLVPGWRIGWGIVSGDAAAVKPYTEGIHRLLRARLCANHPEQYAIKPALEGPQDHLIEVRRKLRSRRDLTQKWCESTPRVSCVAPRGAFYAFPKIDIPKSDEVFVKELIRQKHVMVVHGSGFGQKPGTQHFRIVFLPDEKTLTSAYAGIAEFIRERYGNS